MASWWVSVENFRYNENIMEIYLQRTACLTISKKIADFTTTRHYPHSAFTLLLTTPRMGSHYLGLWKIRYATHRTLEAQGKTLRYKTDKTTKNKVVLAWICSAFDKSAISLHVIFKSTQQHSRFQCDLMSVIVLASISYFFPPLKLTDMIQQKAFVRDKNERQQSIQTPSTCFIDSPDIFIISKKLPWNYIFFSCILSICTWMFKSSCVLVTEIFHLILRHG